MTYSNIYIYVHIYIINDWLDRLTNIINNIKNIGLYYVVKKINCFILGDLEKIPDILKEEKIYIKKQANDESYERFTLNNLYKDSLRDDFYVLYLHTKGVSKPDNIYVNDWIDYMLYFNLNYYKDIINFLENYDTVGVNLLPSGKNKWMEWPVHYSGNYWWSKSTYIKKLDIQKLNENKYNSPEFWITSNCKGNFLSLWNSNVRHYHHLYSAEIYQNKGIKPYIVKEIQQ